MKILLLNITGRFGSTGKIINDLRNYFILLGHEVVIGYGHPDYVDEPGFVQVDHPIESKIVSQFTKLGRAQYKGNPLAVGRIKNIVKDFRPDVVHIHCINGMFANIYKLFGFLSTVHIKTIVTHHAEFFYTGSCGYAFDCLKFSDNQCVGCNNKRKATGNRIFANPHKSWLRMREAVRTFSKEDLCFTAVSPWVDGRSQQSPIVNQYPHHVVMNGIDTDIFSRKQSSELFRENEVKRFDLKPDGRIVLHVSHEFSGHDTEGIKGGGYITLLAKSMPEIDFIVVASVLSDLDDLPENLHIWGSTESRDELANLYSASDITVITSKAETFSMIVAESLCCGTPIAGFYAGGPESIAIPDYSRFVEHGDVNALKRSIEELLVKSFKRQDISVKAKLLYSKERMAEDYLKIYNEMLNGNNIKSDNGVI